MMAVHDASQGSGKKGRRHRVGYSIDMSCDLGNSSHYDVHDASPQGFSVWTEERPGAAEDWYFIMPNVHGRKLDGSLFDGLVIKLFHGAAISWDGRVVRHCTSITMPDGLEDEEGAPVGGHRERDFANHVYGTFTAAKERIVQAGRFAAAAGAAMLGDVPIGDAVGPTTVEAGLDNYVIPKKQRISS